MIETLHAIWHGTLTRLAQQAENWLPPLLVAAAILVLAFVLARLARWLVLRAFDGATLDRFLRRSGVCALLDRSGTLRASRMVAQGVFWAILGAGIAAALNAFGTEFTGRIAGRVVLLFPRLLAAAAIVVAGVWFGRYLGRCVLVWAVDEDMPWPRRLGAAVRALVIFAGVTVAADVLNFARVVFISAFLVVLGGAVLAVSLAAGLGASKAVRRAFHETGREDRDESREPALWHHL